MKKLRTAFIGTGAIANTHARALAAIDDIELVAFTDVDADRARKFADAHAGGKGGVYTDFAEMFERTPLDVVYICLPPFAHTNEVEMAADRGVHYLIEKPIALDAATARRMVEATEKAGVRSQVGFHYRFGEAVETVKGLIADGRAGEPGLFTGRYFCNSLHSAWWRDKSKSGGQVTEQLVHQLDLARHFFGEPVSVFARAANLFHTEVEGYTVEDVSTTAITFTGGAIASVSATNAAIPGKWLGSWEVVTRNLTAFFSDYNHAALHFTDTDGDAEHSISSSRSAFEAEARDLVEAIRTGGETRTPIAEGERTLAVALAAAESAETGREVAVG